MAREDLNKYITKRYDRWLDYSRYHCTQAGMPDESDDVLNEVIAMLLDKQIDDLDRMLESRKGKYRELDFYILRMIKLNIQSDTSPYRHKYKSIPTDDNVDWRRMNITEEELESSDNSDYIRYRLNDVRRILKEIGISDHAIRIFTWKFFAGQSFADWPGTESKKELYETYKNVLRSVRDKISGKLLF